MDPTHAYAITISPRMRNFNKQSYLYQEDLYVLKRELNKCSRYYLIYPEYSVEGRLHYHGIIKIRDSVKWYKSSRHLISSCVGFMKLDPLKTFTDRLRWIVYMSKGWGISRQVLAIKSPIMYTKSKDKYPLIISKEPNILDWFPETESDKLGESITKQEQSERPHLPPDVVTNQVAERARAQTKHTMASQVFWNIEDKYLELL